MAVLPSRDVAPTDNALTREGDVPRTQGDVAGGVAAGLGEEARTQPTASLVVQLDDGHQAVLPRSYAETSTSLGYALTVFRSQGITVDHTFGLGGDSLYQEAGYTQLSRGRLSNNLYVASPDNPRWEVGHHADDRTQRDALQSLVDALSQNREQTMARDLTPDLADRDARGPRCRLPGARHPRPVDRRSRSDRCDSPAGRRLPATP